MRGEKEKMLAGEWFDPHDAELTADRDRATRLMHRLNVECCGHGDDYRTTLGELCPNVRGFIREPFHCDYGYNIHMGEGSAVSYTHLDVYKRQRVFRSSPGRSGSP